MRKTIRIGTRGSKLAMIQTELVADKLKLMNPDCDIEIITIVTAGDSDRLTHLDQIGTDVFVKELEEALLNGRIDCAVHSLKDVPTDIPRGLALIAVTEREDPGDVLVAKATLNDLQPCSRIGTGSLRRTIQLTAMRPDLEACSIRGNVGTRLRKIASGEIDGVILAAAGLKRLGWQHRITQYLPLQNFLPAAGQGALVVESRSQDRELIELVLPVNHLPTWYSVIAERSFLFRLGGGCRAPVAVLGTIDRNTMHLEGMVANPSGEKLLRHSVEGDAAFAEELGLALADQMAEMGASRLIAEAKQNEIR